MYSHVETHTDTRQRCTYTCVWLQEMYSHTETHTQTQDKGVHLHVCGYKRCTRTQRHTQTQDKGLHKPVCGYQKWYSYLFCIYISRGVDTFLVGVTSQDVNHSQHTCMCLSCYKRCRYKRCMERVDCVGKG